MANDLVYADLSLPSEPNRARWLHPAQGFKASQGSRYTQIALWIGWTGNVILLIIVTMLAFQVKHSMDALEQISVLNRTGKSCSETENQSSLENFKSHMRQLLCKPLHNSSAENSGCKLCPENWFHFQNKCYWISKRKQTWIKSKEDCLAKHSQMLVIQNQEEKDFITSTVEGSQLLWIGLATAFPGNKWTWEDGSSLDEKLFHELLRIPVEAKSCGMLYGKTVVSGDCSTVTSWICETEALDISNNV